MDFSITNYITLASNEYAPNLNKVWRLNASDVLTLPCKSFSCLRLQTAFPLIWSLWSPGVIRSSRSGSLELITQMHVHDVVVLTTRCKMDITSWQVVSTLSVIRIHAGRFHIVRQELPTCLLSTCHYQACWWHVRVNYLLVFAFWECCWLKNVNLFTNFEFSVTWQQCL